MHQVWLVLAILGLSATSLGQYSGNRFLDSAIDRNWQRHGGGFLNQESYANDAFKERKISTTIGSFGAPLTSYLGSKHDIPEYSSLYIPEVSLAGGADGLLGMNHEPLKAIGGPLYINNYGKHYDKDVVIGLTRDDDKILYKGHTEHIPHDILYREHPTDKDHVSIVTHIHPSVQEEYLVEKFRKDPFGKDHVTVMKHTPKGDHVVQDKVVYKGHTEHLPHDILHREHLANKDHVGIVTHVHPSVQEEYLVETFKKDPFGKDHFAVKKHNSHSDHVVVDTMYKDLPKGGHIEVKTQEKIYKDSYTPHEEFHGKDHLIVKTEEKVFKDNVDPIMDRFHVDKIHKNIPVRDHFVHETIYKDVKHPGTKLIEKEHALLGSHKLYKDESMSEHILLDKLYKDPYGGDTAHEKTYKNVYNIPDHDGHHRISVKTEEIYEPKLGSYGKDHLTVKTEEKIYKDVPKSGTDKVTVESIYKTHSIGKSEHDEPYFGYEKEYSDDKIDFEDYDEKILEDKHLYRVNEKHVKVDVPIKEHLSTFRTRPTHKTPWPRKENPCGPLSQYQDSPDCKISLTTL